MLLIRAMSSLLYKSRDELTHIISNHMDIMSIICISDFFSDPLMYVYVMDLYLLSKEERGYGMDLLFHIHVSIPISSKI